MCVCRQLLAAPARHDPPRFSLPVCTVLLRHHLALIFNRWRACSDLRSAPQRCACSPSPPPPGEGCAQRPVWQHRCCPAYDSEHYTHTLRLRSRGRGGKREFYESGTSPDGGGLGLGRFPRAGSASPASHCDFIEPFVLCQPRCGPRTATPSRSSLSCFPYLVSFPTFIR